jgi:hypothetical protein
MSHTDVAHPGFRARLRLEHYQGNEILELGANCGGPIEIAVITTDRRFRWVRHKDWDVAIAEGDPA